MKKLILIDGNSLINRAFYAIPLLTNSDGEYCNAVYGFCNIILKIINEQKPDLMAVAFDMGYPTFRHEFYTDYKATRKGMPNELATQLPILKNILTEMKIRVVEKKGIEADDIIGTLAKHFTEQTVIVSGDKDLLQLIDDKTEVWLTKKGISEIVNVNTKTMGSLFNLEPYQIVEIKSLMGDASDNIPGVSGVGEKTAMDLLTKYKTLNGVYEHIEEIKGKLKEKLIEGKEIAYLSKRLATIQTNADIFFDFEDFKYEFPFNRKVFYLFKRYDFNSLLKRSEIFAEMQTNVIEKKINKIVCKTESDVFSLLEEIKKTNLLAIFLDEKLHISLSKFQEYIVEINGGLLDQFVPLVRVAEILKPVLEDEKISKIVLDFKSLKHIFSKFDVYLVGVVFDVVLAQYLLSGSRKTEVDANLLTTSNGFDKEFVSCCLFSLYAPLNSQLKDEDMFNLYYKIELPLVEVLFNMEQNGFKIDLNVLNKLNTEYNLEQASLTKEICELAGQDFNVNSPKQMMEILFEKLNLVLPKGIKKSTNVEVLEALSGQHKIVDKILRYRKIAKLNSTYLEGFKSLIDTKSHLIHTMFNQTLTATGRLSSSEPNLQNIPIKEEEGKKLRKMFVPREPNGCLITADYSQIELRLLAHYSKDPRLIDAYRAGLDIHSKTASDIFNIALEDVTPNMRRYAKTVNFGIIYGISDYGLSQNLGCSRAKAKEIIDRYFATYSKVKEFMNSSKDKARELGWVSSLLGRRRKIDEINSTNYITRQFGERAAMNMPLQGTASDIIKLAMVNVFNAFKKQNLKSKLILQIHDELIVDTVFGEEEIVKKLLKENMENVVPLTIPLTVEIEEGKNWYETH